MRATLSVAFFIFSKFGVSFLGQKRAVGKWEGCTVISKNGLFFRRMFSFGHSRCLPIEEGNMSALSAKYFFARRLFFQVSCCLPHEGILTVSFPKRGDDYKRHLENFSVSGLTLPPSNVRICERFILQVNIFRKFRRPGFTNRPLKVGISEGTFKKFPSQGWLYPLLTSE